MDGFRISTDHNYTLTQKRMQKVGHATSSSMEKLSDGKRIRRPSDDPSGSVRLLGMHKIIANLKQNIRNAEHVNDKLELEDLAIQHMIENIMRCKEVALLANNAAMDNDARMAYTSEIEEITEALVGTFNTQSIEGHYIFGGLNTQIKPVALGKYCFGDEAGQWQSFSDVAFEKGLTPLEPHTLNLSINHVTSSYNFSGK